MIRKIILGFVVLSFLFWNVFADENEKTYTTKDSLWNTRVISKETGEVLKTIWWAEKWWNETINAVNSWNKKTTDAAVSKAQQDAEAAKQPSWWTDTSTSNSSQTSADAEFAKADYDQLRSQWLSDAEAKKQSGYTGPSTEQQAEAARDAACESSWDCLDKPSFVINTWLFSTSGEWLKTWEAKSTINGILWTIIKKLMIALWVISLLIMTIWTWYIILYHGEDEYLSKWKSIFTAWIIALVISLSSYYMVNLVWYILYK